MNCKKRGIETTIEEVFLRNIGVNSLDNVNSWFKKSYANNYRLDKVEDAVALCNKFHDKQVTIIGDYDVDGVNSVEILLKTLKLKGFKYVKYRIPDRITEGFGINPKIVDEIDEGLIITCDNGIAGIEAIKRAKEKGLTVIIIDHHEPVKEKIIENGIEKEVIVLPEADIIIDPNAIPNSADFNGYCGAGLCYKFAVEMLQDKNLYAPLQINAALATICDVMELREENYVFVRNGLSKMKYSTMCTKGLYALICQYDINKHITAHDIGFKIGPALNAPGRLLPNGANISVDLLDFNGDFSLAVNKAESLVKINEQRKQLKKDALKQTNKLIEDECMYGDNPLVLYLPNVEEGIVGIIAGNIAENFKVPTLVFTDAEEKELLKGSGRSFGNYDMKANLDKCPELFVKYGGHPGAAGMTIKKENLLNLREFLNANIENYIAEESNITYYDLEIKASEIPSMIEELKKYEPFGEGNPSPVFKVTDFQVYPRNGKYKTCIGEDASILKLYGKNATAIGFDMAARFANIDKPKVVNLIGTLSDNYFRGEITHQIEFIDFEVKETDTIQTDLASKLAFMAKNK